MKTLNATLILVFICSILLIPCTTAIVSGKATLDGRPLLLKNRDADSLQNKLVFFSEGKYKFIGLVDAYDTSNSAVWCGFNETGFGIMNSASYNLKGEDTTQLADREGILMKLALGQCATIEDFEKLLKELPKPLGVEANFGVIDGKGGAAYFETTNYDFIKYDANDPEVAPNGYLIRTNYSFAGQENKGYGYIRYTTASEMFEKKYNQEKISFEFLINDIPRCLIHSFTKTDLSQSLPENLDDTDYVYFRDYIPRYFTSAAIVIQGVAANESPSLTTMWTILGFTFSSIIIPVWLLDDGTLPSILQADESGNAPLCDLAFKLKEDIFPEQNDARENYINLAALMNKENTGIRQKIIPIEEELLTKAKEKLALWRTSGINTTEVKDFYKWVENQIYPSLKNQLKVN